MQELGWSHAGIVIELSGSQLLHVHVHGSLVAKISVLTTHTAFCCTFITGLLPFLGWKELATVAEAYVHVDYFIHVFPCLFQLCVCTNPKLD